MIIGLTGGLATGKTTIAQLLQKDGYSIIDADKITYQLYESDKVTCETIAKLFPEAVTAHKINRPILAQKIASNPQLLPVLESYMHPLIKKEIQRRIDDLKTDKKPLILVVPLLFETQLNDLCDQVICLYAPPEIQRQRAFERPLMTASKFDTLIHRQWTNEQRKQLADLWVSTTDPIETTYQTIRQFLHNL